MKLQIHRAQATALLLVTAVVVTIVVAVVVAVVAVVIAIVNNCVRYVQWFSQPINVIFYRAPIHFAETVGQCILKHKLIKVNY